MVLEGLGKSLRDVLKKVAKANHVDEELVKEITRDLQRALLQADVNVQLVLRLTKCVEERTLSEKPPAGKSAREYVVRIIYEELVKIVGNAHTIPLNKQTIMMVGLYGNGKTTTTGKLAYFFNKKGMSVGLIAGDVHRPAAYEQLKQIGEKVGVPVYGEPGNKDAALVVTNGLEAFRDKNVRIIDTSGRHALEDDLIQEIKDVANAASPDERILIMDASTGQAAGTQAKAFHEAVGVTSVIITKMDGTAKGGGALSAVSQTNAGIAYIGTGEHIRDLDPFDPNRFISRLLGMGDLQALMEVAQESMTEDDVAEVTRKIMAGKFTLKEMYEQMEALNKMGPLQKVMSMLPCMNGMMDKVNVEESQEKLKRYRIIMDSMTEEEMEEPKIIKSSRVLRISRGAGVEPRDVRELLKQYNNSKKMVKGFMGNRKLKRQLMKQMQSGDLGE